MRPSRSKLLTAVTVSRRSAAGICTAVQDAPRKDGERAVTSLLAHCAARAIGCRAVERAKCTTAVLLPRRQQQPRQQHQQEAEWVRPTTTTEDGAHNATSEGRRE